MGAVAAPQPVIPSSGSMLSAGLRRELQPVSDAAAAAAAVDRPLPSRQLNSSPSPSSSPSSPIRVRDLAHLRALAGQDAPHRRYEISSMPVADVIEMVAGLLSKITATNDRQHEHLHRHIPRPDAGSLPPQTSSVLAFHGKNVPGITILNYLSRIHKYCPTTYEVFLSLLVYFDRMTEAVNAHLLRQMQRRVSSPHTSSSSPFFAAPADSSPRDDPSDSDGDLDDPDSLDELSFSHFLVVDSYNIHRLVIAGVTCASKFFSDVFYTNSRYAKVGGLPLLELNHLELQFLLLNDFRLAVPVEELDAYGTMLVQFYAREIAQGGSLGSSG